MVYECLLKHEPINFFKFLINPESFSQTVENLFYCAFLTRDGRVSIQEDDDGDLILGIMN